MQSQPIPALHTPPVVVAAPPLHHHARLLCLHSKGVYVGSSCGSSAPRTIQGVHALPRAGGSYHALIPVHITFGSDHLMVHGF